MGDTPELAPRRAAMLLIVTGGGLLLVVRRAIESRLLPLLAAGPR
jgi:hypothetical protein